MLNPTSLVLLSEEAALRQLIARLASLRRPTDADFGDRVVSEAAMREALTVLHDTQALVNAYISESLNRDPSIDRDRHMIYALRALASLRHGESSGLRWRHEPRRSR